MKIRKIILENIRSHRKSIIEFKDGFTCIVGGVGEGKSSILYSIHMALMGERLGKSYDYLLREGEDEGLITLEFEHRGRIYKAIRKLKRIGRRISQDPDSLALFEGDKLIASKKASAIDEQIKTITGITRETFKDVIWIQQEKLKELLNMESSKRQETLDKLFGISEFLEAWRNLRFFESRYEGEKLAYERDADILSIDRLKETYDKVYYELVQAQIKLEELEKSLKESEKHFEELRSLVEKLEEDKRMYEEALRRTESLKVKINEKLNSIRELQEAKAERNRIKNELEKELKLLEEEFKGLEETIYRFEIYQAFSIESLQKVKEELEKELLQLAVKEQELSKSLEEIERNKLWIDAGICPTCKRTFKIEEKEMMAKRIEVERNEMEKLKVNIPMKRKEIESKRKVLDEVLGKLPLKLSEKNRMEKELEEQIVKVEEIEGRIKEEEENLKEVQLQFESISKELETFNEEKLREAIKERDRAYEAYASFKANYEYQKRLVKEIERRAEELKSRIKTTEEKIKRKERIEKILRIIGEIRKAYKAVGPSLRKDYTKVLAHFTQSVLYDMMADAERQYIIDIDETYTPRLKEEDHWRDIFSLSGGERTMLAFAYKIAIGELLMKSKGQTLDLLILDEPTESLGPEDRSIERLAEALSRLKDIEQIIAVTHSEDFARKAEHVIRVRKIAGESQVSIVR